MYKLTYYSELTKRTIDITYETIGELINQLLLITSDKALNSYTSIQWQVIEGDG